MSTSTLSASDWKRLRFDPYAVIDPRLDVAAQRSILRLAKGSERDRVTAATLLAAVKAERLDGIYGDDLRRSAQLAGQLGTVRWKLVPPGRDAVILTPGPKALPAVVFREGVRSTPTRLDTALRTLAPRLQHMIAKGVQSGFVPVSVAPANPWMCALLCALCAAAILDGVPGDEIPACALCLGACARGSA